MTAPAGSQILSFINASFQQQGSGGSAFFKQLADTISTGWATWETGLSFGAVIVAGAGVGAWVGAGNGGTVQGAPYQLPPFTFQKQDPHQAKLVDGLRQAMPQLMTKWVTTFKFTGLQYTGSSTATPSNPGTVTAVNVPTPLATAGKGTAPSAAPAGTKMADLWLKLLTAPDFDLTNPMGKTTELVNAITGAVEQAFDTIWLLGAKATANQLSGAAANGGAVPGLATTASGKIV